MYYTIKSHKHQLEQAESPLITHEDNKIYIIGKAYSIETLRCCSWCDSRNIAFHFVDLELDENADYWQSWIKARRILSIPVVLLNRHYSVGFDDHAMNTMINQL